MGIGELLGVKQIKIETKTAISIQELFEKIKDIPFEAGTPQLVKNGFAWVIAFPELDRNNQVQILGDKGKFYVTRSVQPAGLGNLAKNLALEQLTDGWSSMSAAFGNKKKLCMHLTELTAETLKKLEL